MARTRKAKPKADDHDQDQDQDQEQATDGEHVNDATVNGDEPEEDDGVEHSTIPFNDKSITCERRGKGEKLSLIFTHGAGGGITAPATKDFSDGFGEVATIVTFQGNMNLKSRVKTYHAVTEHLDFDTALGGRSMGSRAAAIVASEDDSATKALVLVSFPLIGATKKDSREQILLDIPQGIDVLFITGTKDSMCDLDQLAEVATRMKVSCWFAKVQDADHGMAWKWKDSVEAMRRKTGAVAAGWLEERDPEKRYCSISWNEEASELACSGWQEDEGENKTAQKEVETGAEEPPAKKRKRGKKT